MPDKHWEPPPEQAVRDPQPTGSHTDQPRNLETRGHAGDADRDVRYEEEQINFDGSER